MDFTIGQELHLTPKTFAFLLETQYSIGKVICQQKDENMRQVYFAFLYQIFSFTENNRNGKV